MKSKVGNLIFYLIKVKTQISLYIYRFIVCFLICMNMCTHFQILVPQLLFNFQLIMVGVR